MGAYSYCTKCGAGMPKPEASDLAYGYICRQCGATQDHQRTIEEVVAELAETVALQAERIEHLEHQVHHLTNGTEP